MRRQQMINIKTCWPLAKMLEIKIKNLYGHTDVLVLIIELLHFLQGT